MNLFFIDEVKTGSCICETVILGMKMSILRI